VVGDQAALLFLLVKAWRGETWRVPAAGDLAVKIASK
jgi:uncharacterized membrane protein